MLWDGTHKAESETMAEFEQKFNEKVIRVTLHCDCGVELDFPFPMLEDVMLRFVAHTC